MLVVDISASLHFSHVRQLKSELIAELAATLAFSAIKNQDKVGLLLFTDEVELYLKPKKGVRHVLRVMREILYFKPKQRGTDLSKALSFLGLVQKKKTICFVISDFLCPDFQLEANLAAKRHELIAFHVFDVFENHFSPRALFSFYDLETEEEKVIDTADEEVIEHFDQRTKEYQKSVQNLFERAGASYISMHTGESSSSILKRFFRLRKRVIAFPENNALFELAR